jgi:hypothetical protein
LALDVPIQSCFSITLLAVVKEVSKNERRRTNNEEALMSVAGIFTTPYFSTPYTSNGTSQSLQQNNNLQFQQSFEQLGQDLQAGNLSGAEQDLATLQQINPQSASTTSTQSNNPITQTFNQLAIDLQSGNLSGAQQAYSNIQQDSTEQNSETQDQTGQTEGHHHHHHGGGGGGANEINQLLQTDSTQSNPTQSGSSLTVQPPSYSFLSELPYAQPLGQSPGASSVSFNA